ncbi:putative replication-association protein [Cyclovirus CN9E]|nr:putative replication-association protein [Cyclovirus CN9E]
MRGVRWCFTCNNYTEEDERAVRALTGVKYAVYGREEGERNKTRHLQGYVHFTSRKEFGALKRSLGDRFHIEQARGSDAQNYKYCTKGGDYWETGRLVGQGHRSDLDGVLATIQSGATYNQIAIAHPHQFIRYHRGIRAYFGALEQLRGRSTRTRCLVLWGDSGSGKSYTARRVARSFGSCYYKTRGEWWDGYDGQEVVVIDDFYGWLKYDELLRILDEYPLQVPIKGNFTNFRSLLVIITSNVCWEEWYHGTWFKDQVKAALQRRLDWIYKYPEEKEQMFTDNHDLFINKEN